MSIIAHIPKGARAIQLGVYLTSFIVPLDITLTEDAFSGEVCWGNEGLTFPNAGLRLFPYQDGALLIDPVGKPPIIILTLKEPTRLEEIAASWWYL